MLAAVKTRDNSHALEQLIPYTAAFPIPDKGQMLYLCRDGACSAPVKTLEELRAIAAPAQVR